MWRAGLHNPYDRNNIRGRAAGLFIAKLIIAKLIVEDTEKWAKMIRATGIKAE
jgi:hypothetical protein